MILLNRKQKKYKHYPRISLGLKSKLLVQEIEKWIKLQGMTTTTTYNILCKNKRGFEYIEHRLHINGRKNLEKWMNIVSFRNPRHISRYKKYKNELAEI